MITRIIKLTVNIAPEDFLKYMESIKSDFDDFEGCKQLEVLRGKIDGDVFFIYTTWEKNVALNIFRRSDFNKKFWKKLLDVSQSRPQVWSVENIFEK
jgi:heme-degrading monooxygenase HmoA